MQESDGALVCENVGVRFGGLAALSGVSLTVKYGEIVGLIGPNGAGKSTLINVLSGFQRATDGHVLLDGHRVDHMQPQRLARRGLVRTFQAVRLFKGLTVHENVDVASTGHRPATKPVDEILSWVGLSRSTEKLAGDLSYGDQRRLAIARALATGPRFVLLDEPAAGMNEHEIEELKTLLTRIRDELGCALIVIEHNMPLIMDISDHIVVLAGGKVIATGSACSIRSNAVVREAYLGSVAEMPS
jgi:branched-chain amino acid transport system ATP-binding protein